VRQTTTTKKRLNSQTYLRLFQFD